MYNARGAQNSRIMSPEVENVTPTRTAQSPGTARARPDILLLTACCVLVLIVYVWLISVGTWTHWPTRWNSYDSLATSFRHGRLDLEMVPDTALLALPDPYDPAARTAIPAPQDVSLYKGRFYLYFGPVPALILLVVKAVIGGTIGDQILVFAFCSGIFLLQAVLMARIRHRFFPKTTTRALAPLILAAGLINPWVSILSTPSIYNAAITGGQFFFLAGLLMAFSTFEDTPLQARKLAATGLLWVAAFGSRVTLIVPVGLLTVLVVIAIGVSFHRTARFSSAIRPMLALILILGFGLAAFGWYNWARFGSVFETGFAYQLAGVPLQKAAGQLLSPMYVIQNLYNYFLNPPLAKYAFPYLYPVRGATVSLIPSFNLPVIYHAQETTGLLYTAPFALLGLLPPITILTKLPSRLTGKAHADWFRWLIAGLSLSFLSAFAYFVSFFWVAERYIADFLPCLMLMSAIGLWQLDGVVAARRGGRAFLWLTIVSLVTISIVISILLAISFNSDGFRQLNPLLWRQLSNLFRP